MSADPVCVSLCGYMRRQHIITAVVCQPIRSASASAVRTMCTGDGKQTRVSRSGLRQPLRYPTAEVAAMKARCQPIRSASASAVFVDAKGMLIVPVSADPVCVSLCGLAGGNLRRRHTGCQPIRSASASAVCITN